jgi:hypothetical protein
MHEKLEQWKNNSPNNTPNNTLIRSEGLGCVCFGWNLKPNDPKEKDFCWNVKFKRQIKLKP